MLKDLDIKMKNNIEVGSLVKAKSEFGLAYSTVYVGDLCLLVSEHLEVNQTALRPSRFKLFVFKTSQVEELLLGWYSFENMFEKVSE